MSNCEYLSKVEVRNHIRNRISCLDEYCQSNECQNFDTSEVCKHLSSKNNLLLGNIDVYTKIYLGCLNNVCRWKKHIFQELAGRTKETDYDHVLAMLKINQEIKNLGISSIDHDEVEVLILIHDGGEIITDDMSMNYENSQELFIKRNKKIEPKVFKKYVLNYLGNNFESEKNYFNDLYCKYEKRSQNPQDINSHLVKLIDMWQGNDFGLKQIYSQNKLKSAYQDNIPVDPNIIIENLIQKEIFQTQLVLSSVNNKEDQQKLFDYLNQNHFSKYNNPEYGYQDLYGKYKDQIDRLSPFFLSLSSPDCGA